ncbi:MAG: hypothetical protein ABSB67_14335 [Bryobacteraceae bacterium]|jgi:hypothetical protein
MSISPSIRSLANLTVPTKYALDLLEREWHPDSPPLTVAAAAVARSFGDARTSLSVGDIETVGKFVELLLTTADEDTQTAVATGYLESLLAQASSGAIDFRSIAGTLGPESSKYCRAWDTFTGVKTDGLW